MIIWAILLHLSMGAQVTVGISADRDSMLVGELINLSVKINGDISEIESIDFTPLQKMYNALHQMDSSMMEKYLDVSVIDGGAFGINNQKLLLTGDQLKATEGVIRLGVYTFGYAQLNNPIVKLKDGTEPMYLQRSILMVKPPDNIQAMIDSMDLADIRPIMEEGTHWTDYLDYLYGLLALAAIGLLAWYLLKRKTEDEVGTEYETPVVVIPAHITALESLSALDGKKLWQQGQIKEYQSELTDIMRGYIDGRYNIPGKEMTTSQIKKALQSVQLEDQQISTFTDILQIADIVKFAKGTAGPEMNQKFMDDARHWVETTKENVPIAE